MARFFAQLTPGSLQRRFARIAHPAGYLQRKSLDAEAILSDKQYVVVSRQRDDVDPLGSFDAVKSLGRSAIRRLEAHRVDVEDAAVL